MTRGVLIVATVIAAFILAGCAGAALSYRPPAAPTCTEENPC